MARAAWDFFQKKHARKRAIEELWYAPNYSYDGPHWVCQLAMRDTDTMHWGFTRSALEHAYPSTYIKKEMGLT